MAQPVLGVFYWLHWVLLRRESWFWVISHHSTAWLYLFPYSVSRRNKSVISKGNVLSYYHNLGSLRYRTSTAFLVVLWAAHLSCFLRRNMRCGGEVAAYIARCYFGGERLGYVCNPRSLKEGTETSRRRTDELGYRLERPIHFECKLNEPMHIGMRLLHPAAADHSVSINRQQVQRIFRFSLRSRAGNRPLSGGTGAVATGRDVSVPSFRERGLHT